LAKKGKDMASKTYVSDTRLQYALNKLKSILDAKYKANNATITIKKNGTTVDSFTVNTATDKDIDIAVPVVDSAMSATSTNAIQNSVVKKYVDDAVKDITGISFEVVESLPATGATGKIYLVANSSSIEQNIYDEYIWLASTSTYEKIGSTNVDLSNYLSESNEITEGGIDTIFTAIFG